MKPPVVLKYALIYTKLTKTLYEKDTVLYNSHILLIKLTKLGELFKVVRINKPTYKGTKITFKRIKLDDVFTEFSVLESELKNIWKKD